MRQNNPLLAQGGAGGQNVAGYVGEITYFADNILRKNHVWADGAPIDAAQWPQLAEYAATAGWAQNSEGQYLVPDLRGRFLLGASDAHAVGSIGGEEEHTLTVAESPRHSHDILTQAGGVDNDLSGVIQRGRTGSSTNANKQTQYSGDGEPHNNMPPYYAVAPQIRAKVDTIYAKAIIACPYEVGDILQTKNSTLPSERWPGTEWAPIETFLLGASTTHPTGEEDGEEEHTLTVEEMPAHNHDKIFVKSISQGNIGAAAGNDAAAGTGRRDITFNNVSDLYTSYTGGSQPHNNMPPYTAVYIWERTA